MTDILEIRKFSKGAAVKWVGTWDDLEAIEFREGWSVNYAIMADPVGVVRAEMFFGDDESDHYIEVLFPHIREDIILLPASGLKLIRSNWSWWRR